MMGVGMSSYSAYQQAKAENMAKQWNSQMATRQAELATANSLLATKKAGVLRTLGDTEYGETIQEYEGLRSRQREDYAAGGVNVNVGSAILAQTNTAKQGVYEAQKAEYQRDMQAWEMDIESWRAQQSAKTYQMEAAAGMASQINPWVPAVSQAIGGASSVFGTYGSWQR